MKRLLSLLTLTLLSLQLMAHEGMWLPHLIKAMNYAEMRAHGLELTPEELYNAEGSSLKDAIVSLGGFCTAEVISGKGLLLTNHHCGYDAIRTHSTPEADYLTDGFWAMNMSQELPNEGLTATFVVRIQNVTAEINDKIEPGISKEEREQIIRTMSKQLAEEAKADSHYDAFVRSFFHGNEFYLFVTETFEDVRLVGAPPSSIGKYGGDTDNWMWPRHTGDFSLFRIYSGPDGKPAPYSEENIPLKPRHFLPISMDGVSEDDFAMIFGFPGSTDRYLSSHGVQQAIDIYNPSVVDVRDLKLEIMRKYMNADDAVRIKYASNYASTANYWKYYIGQTEQLQNNKVYEKKKELELRYEDWAMSDESRKGTHGKVLRMFEDAYAAKRPYVKAEVYNREALLLGPSHVLFALRAGGAFDRWAQAYQAIEEAEDDEAEAAARKKYEAISAQMRPRLQESAEEFFAEIHAPMEKELMASLFQLYADDIPEDQQPEFIQDYDGKMDKLVKKAWKKSIYADKERFMEALEDPDFDDIQEDLLGEIAAQAYDLYRGGSDEVKAADEKLEVAYRMFTAGIRKMMPQKRFSPDANSTLRMTWGVVGSYEPRDGVKYNYYTTLEGVMQKMDPSNDEFVVPERLQKLYEMKDYGPYSDENGDLVVCFISNNDITGGNSGSPVINGHGELIGTAFDGNWEAMSGDIFFEEELQRTISVDIRYTLFIIDKYAGAGHLIEEMKLVRRDEPTTTASAAE